MSYIAFAWMTTILYALGSIVGKIASKHHVTNPWLYNFIWTALTVVCIVPFAIVHHVGWPQDWQSMVILGLVGTVSGTSYILALHALDLSILSPLYTLRTPFVALLGVFFFRETLSLFQFGLIGLMCVAGMFVNMDERMSVRALFGKKLAIGLIAIATSVAFNLGVKYASLHNGYWEVSWWSNVLSLLFILPTLPLFYRDLAKTKIRTYQGITWSTILITLGLLTSFKALGQNVGISMAIISLPFSMVLAMVLSIVWPKLLEKHTAKVYAIRFTAAAVMFVAALGLSK